MSPPSRNWIGIVRAPLWSFTPLSATARRILFVVVAVSVVGEALFRATNEAQQSLAGGVFGTASVVAIALFAWRPPVAAVILGVAPLIATVSGVATGTLLGSVVLVGLVVATCSPALTALYVAAQVAWCIVDLVRPDGLYRGSGAIVLTSVGLVSLAVGITLRQQQDRWRRLADQMARQEQELAEQLEHEREMIADELHDIVAHEITIVALHAAALERITEPEARLQSQTAIRQAATQALTDIRRVLGMVRGEENLAPERIPTPDNLESALDAVVAELGSAGIEVGVEVPDDLELPNAAVFALIRVIRESATNVLKHATGAQHVRIVLTVDKKRVHLQFSDDSPVARSAGLPSSGYGIMRLHERFRLFGGTFTSERGRNGWIVKASLPLSS